jgi:uncharacterized protein YciI
LITVVELTYKVPIADIEAATADHRAYLRTLLDKGLLLISGPLSPRTGGILLLKTESLDEAWALVKDDPFFARNLAEYSLRLWNPVMGVERLA